LNACLFYTVQLSPYVHVGIAWVEHDRVWVMDMTTKGCSPRLLSKAGDFDIAPSPRELSKESLVYAFEQFGELEYSKWQAVMGALNILKLNEDNLAQCAEYALGVYAASFMSPCTKATPAACAEGAMLTWGSSITSVKNS